MKVAWNTPMTREIHEASLQVSRAKKGFDHYVCEWSRSIGNILGALDDDEFWEQVDVLRNNVATFRDKRGRSNWPEQAVDEMIRSDVVSVKKPDEAYCRLLRFARFRLTYDLMVDLAAGKLEGKPCYVSDDSFSNICDSYPLHGRKVFEDSMKGNLPAEPSLGENYISMALHNSLNTWVPIVLGDLYRPLLNG